MNLSFWIQKILVFGIPTVFAITLHEVAHGYVARHFGDHTAWSAGRLTLNPAKHIDPLGTVLMPLVFLLATGGAYALGAAKPVPVQFGNLQKPRQHGLLVVLAGPASNFVQAFAWAVLLLLLGALGIQERFFLELVRAGVVVNLAMLAFNLLPVPPLDGGRALTLTLPAGPASALAGIEPFGFVVVTLLLISRLIDDWWMTPLMNLGLAALQVLLLPLNSFLN